MTSVGAFIFDDLAVATFPRELTFGPDNLTAYSVKSTGELDVWNATTQQLSGQIATDGQVNELFLDPTARFLFASYDNQLVIYSTGRSSISINQGDVNFNRQVDPGETWLYGLTSTVETGEFTHGISADASDILATTVSLTEQVSYTGADRVSLAEQVSGGIVIDLPDTPTDAQLSDSRFELTDNQVRLKSGEFLSSDSDDELELVLRTSDPESEFIRMIVLDVAANASPWQNAANRYDVTGNTVITAIDSLTIINEIERRGVTSGDPIELGPRPADRNVFYDVSGDGRLSALDALLVINELNRDTSSSEPIPASEAVAAPGSDSSQWDWLADRNRCSRLDATNIDAVFSQ